MVTVEEVLCIRLANNAGDAYTSLAQFHGRPEVEEAWFKIAIESRREFIIDRALPAIRAGNMPLMLAAPKRDDVQDAEIIELTKDV